MFRGQSSNKSRAPPPDRKCIKCGNGTRIRIRNGKEIADWYKLNGGYQCRKCYKHEVEQRPEVRKRNNELDMTRYWRTHDRKKPYRGGPSIPSRRQCIECSSYETWVNPLGYAEWFMTSGGYLCKKCNDKKRRKIPEVNAKLKAIHRKYSWKPNVKKHKRIYQQIIRNDRIHAREIEKTQNAFAIFAKTAEDPSLIENVKLQMKQEEEQKRARKNATRRRWRAKRKALGLPRT